ncbi:cupin domain-containing protein [Hyalangium sp.]|uniref:cupin domain-containing protein n=1 Tax=Hyalangium sp. TaxID=2028555 RepID=UPI002D46810A|nr:cupin domain-containing protein [Hyalangium sp.]HYI00444.1 cupin domain-containing protein [Hyalangium sp.]
MSPPSAGPVPLAVDLTQQASPLEAARPRALPEPHEPSLPSRAPLSTEAAIEELHARLASHPFWDNRLLQACRRGVLTREDFAFIFSQYALFTRSSARFVHALMVQCDSELWCTKMTQVLWEETGAPTSEKRPTALFRRFLRDGLGVEVESIRFLDCTRYLVRECLDGCLRPPASAASAFLAFGLEAPIPRLFSVFVDALLHADVSERHLAFFHRKMDDSARASLLEELVRAHSREPGWFDTSMHALEQALELQGRFFESLFEALQHQRLGPLLERIQARQPLAPECPEPSTVHLSGLSNIVPFYRHAHELRGIDFAVDRVPFPAEVLETTRLRVAPSHGTEPREHAHELLLAVMSGTGRVEVRGTQVDVKPGDAVFIPRWASYQAHATGPEPLELLAVTDHGLTRRAHAEEVLRAARLKSATGVDL